MIDSKVLVWSENYFEGKQTKTMFFSSGWEFSKFIDDDAILVTFGYFIISFLTFMGSYAYWRKAN